MLKFWRNPEFVRHLRAELRPARALTVAVIVLVICSLAGLACWSGERANLREFFRLYYAWLIGLQYVMLGFWCASVCGQGLARERELKTYDFLRTTRLSSGELLVGKLLGVPVLAYFAVGCSLPVSLVVGILGGFGPRALLENYLLLVVFSIFISLMALWGSMLVEKSGAGAVGLFGLIVSAMFFSYAQSPFPGFAAVSVLPAVFSLHGVSTWFAQAKPTLFGLPVSFLVLSLLLYATLGAWWALMLVRNLKKDPQQIRLLSRWQAIGLAAYLNLIFYAFLDPKFLAPRWTSTRLAPKDVSTLAVAINAAILFLVGLTTLTPYERLKVWWRRRAAGEESYLSEEGLPWPWLLPAAAVAYAFLAVEAAGLRATTPLRDWRLGVAAVQLLVFLVFTTRDILFLQWCNLTHMKRPVFKGLLYLFLYYLSVGIVGLVMQAVQSSRAGYVLALTPYYALNAQGLGVRAASEISFGMALQLPLIAWLLRAIDSRLSRPAVVPAVAAA